MTRLALTKDINGVNTFGLPVADDKRNFTLTNAGGELTATVPSLYSRYLAVFSYEPGAKVWFAVGGTAIQMPVANTINTTNAELNASAREVLAGQTLRFKTNDASVEVGILFYEL